MSEAILTEPPVTIAVFEAFLDCAGRFAVELVAGRIVAMTNPTEVHEQIASNIGAPLKLAMDPKAAMSIRRHRRSAVGPARRTNRARPDVVVRCGRLAREFHHRRLVVVEVLSPSTMDVDRGEKLQFYKAQPTLRHIALVYQDQMRVEHYRKTISAGSWSLTHAAMSFTSKRWHSKSRSTASTSA